MTKPLDYTAMKLLDDEGNEVPTTDEEKKAALMQLRECLLHGRIEMAPDVAKDIEERGLTVEEIEAWMADAAGLKQ